MAGNPLHTTFFYIKWHLFLFICVYIALMSDCHRDKLHIWLLNFLHKFCHIIPIITCAWVLCSPLVSPSYKLPRETRKLSAHQLGEGGGDAFFSHGSLTQHPWPHSDSLPTALYVLGHSTESMFCASISFPEFLLISFFSLSYFPVSPVCCLRSFWTIKYHYLQGQEAASLQRHVRHGTELQGIQLCSSHDLLHCYSAQLFAWKPSANICPNPEIFQVSSALRTLKFHINLRAWTYLTHD